MSELAVRNGHSTDLAEVGDSPAQQYQSQTVARLTDWAHEARAAGAIAKSLCDTEFVPKHFRGNAAATTAAILTGFEVGLPPMAALRALYVIGGTPAMYAATMRGLLQSKGHEVWEEESSATRVVVKGRRKGSQKVHESVWTIERAKTAELLSNAHYRKNPQNMLSARATAEVCRKVAADLLYAVPYSVEELDDGSVGNVEVPAIAPAEPKKRTMKRAAPAPTATPEPDFDETPAAAPSGPDEQDDPISKPQMALLQKLFTDAGTTDAQAKRDYCTQVLGRTITSVTELSKYEATRVIDHLQPVEEPPSVDAELEPEFDGPTS